MKTEVFKALILGISILILTGMGAAFTANFSVNRRWDVQKSVHP